LNSIRQQGDEVLTPSFRSLLAGLWVRKTLRD
jgi:hypothetical protein